jgi:hypothetical protein
VQVAVDLHAVDRQLAARVEHASGQARETRHVSGPHESPVRSTRKSPVIQHDRFVEGQREKARRGLSLGAHALERRGRPFARPLRC